MKKMTKQNIIYSSLFLVLFAIAIFALVFSMSDIDCKFLKFSVTVFKDIMSVFVSAVALVITAYFVILAIDAYSSVQAIKKTKEDVQNDVNDITNRKKELDILLRVYTQSLYDGLETQIELAELTKSEKLRNDLVIAQARMSYQYPMLVKETRIELLSKLYDIGELKDINNVKLLMLNPNEDAQIREYAELVFANLKSTFGVS